MSLEIKPLTRAETEQMLENFNRSDRVSVLKRTNGHLAFEESQRPLTMEDFEPTD